MPSVSLNERSTANFLSVNYTFICCQSPFFHYKTLCTTYTASESLFILRDHSGHSSTFILCDSGVQQGAIRVDSHVGSGGIQGGCPGPSA